MKYSLGLDIGTTSVGWAVIDLEKERIHDLGVRIFKIAEGPKGESPAKNRREARGSRRRLKRRRQRLNHLKRFFVKHNILTEQQIEHVLSPSSEYNQLDVYMLRDKAIREELTPEELLKVIYQISKRRGFKSNRKVIEESDTKGEDGAVTKALKTNSTLLSEKNYETVGVALNRDGIYKARKRNGTGSYTNSFARSDFTYELNLIIDCQRKYALKNITKQSLDSLLNEGVSSIMFQRPYTTKQRIEKMVGTCTLENKEKRAPRASYSFELFRTASKLSHLAFIPREKSSDASAGEYNTIKLSPGQIATVINKAKRTTSLTYAGIRIAAGISDHYAIDPRKAHINVTPEDPFGEDVEFKDNFKAYHIIRIAFKKLPEEWKKIDNEPILNEIGSILTLQKTDDAIREEIGKLELPKGEVLSDEARDILVNIKPTHFKSFGHLSIKALQKITPHIISHGLTYDKACKEAGYNFQKQKVDLEEVTNPVVKRAVTQTNKVVKAIIRKYGAPHRISIETTRDLTKSYEDRKTITFENQQNQEYNNDIKSIIELGYAAQPRSLRGKKLVARLIEFNVPLHSHADFNSKQITKVKLYDEQNGRCLYSNKPIDWSLMISDDNAYQIDHIAPQSRSTNDSLTNKILTTTEENQLKANRTPFEYFGGDQERWRQYVANVEAIYKIRDVKTNDKGANKLNYTFNSYAAKKRQNLLSTDHINDPWSASHLQSTRYITRFIRKYLKQTVDITSTSNHSITNILTPNGALTAYIRKRLGLNKVREENVLHHAIDAAIVGAIDDKTIFRANVYAKKGEVSRFLANTKTMREKTDVLTGEITDDADFSRAQQENMMHEVLSAKHFPPPWTDFAKEVRKRTLNSDTDTIRNELRGLENYDEAFRLSVKPVFVSRMQNRKFTGRAHQDTVRSARVIEDNLRTIRMPLSKVRLQELEHALVDPQLRATIKQRLEENDNNPEKAFASDINKYNKHGQPVHKVRAIKIVGRHNPESGFILENRHRGFVGNGKILRLDVYSKMDEKGRRKYYFVPIFVHQIPMIKRDEKITEIRQSATKYRQVDETFEKEMSIYKNDYLKVYYNNKVREGYFQFYESDGRLNLLAHADAQYDQKKGRASGPSATLIERYDISILGDNAPKN